jgi:hypothetical protein
MHLVSDMEESVAFAILNDKSVPGSSIPPPVATRPTPPVPADGSADAATGGDDGSSSLPLDSRVLGANFFFASQLFRHHELVRREHGGALKDPVSEHGGNAANDILGDDTVVAAKLAEDAQSEFPFLSARDTRFTTRPEPRPLTTPKTTPAHLPGDIPHPDITANVVLFDDLVPITGEDADDDLEDTVPRIPTATLDLNQNSNTSQTAGSLGTGEDTTGETGTASLRPATAWRGLIVPEYADEDSSATTVNPDGALANEISDGSSADDPLLAGKSKLGVTELILNPLWAVGESLDIQDKNVRDGSQAVEDVSATTQGEKLSIYLLMGAGTAVTSHSPMCYICTLHVYPNHDGYYAIHIYYIYKASIYAVMCLYKKNL